MVESKDGNRMSDVESNLMNLDKKYLVAEIERLQVRLKDALARPLPDDYRGLEVQLSAMRNALEMAKYSFEKIPNHFGLTEEAVTKAIDVARREPGSVARGIREALAKAHDLALQLEGPDAHPNLGAIRDWCNRGLETLEGKR
jgi:hypothetical protein